MTRFVHLIPGSPEWHEHRTRYWNASDAPAMMGVSPHETRSQLLHRLYCLRNGLPVPEPDEATQWLFAEGHRTEALARPIAEALLDDELAVLRVVNEPFAASLDGRTLEGMHWECKLLNAGIREAIPATPRIIHSIAIGAELPLMYRVQVAHQHMCDAAAIMTMFTGAEFDRDGNLLDARHCYVARDEGLIAQVAAGWRQFEKDLAAYVPQEAPPVVVPAAQEHLPAVSVQVSGSLMVRGNLDELKPRLAAFIARIPKSPSTDQEFADVGAAGKRLREVQAAVENAVNGALASIADVNELQRIGKELAEMARQAAISCERAEASGKEAVKQRETIARAEAMDAHLRAANTRLGGAYITGSFASFGAVIKGLKTLASVRDKLDTELARAKIECDQLEHRIAANLATLAAAGPEHQALFADRGQLVHKDPEAVQAIVSQRVAEHRAAEDRRLAAERERIRIEEAAKAQAAAAAQVPAAQVAEAARPGGGTPPLGTPAPAAPSAAPTANTTAGAPPLKLADICDRLGWRMTAAEVKDLGVPIFKQSVTVLVAASDVPRLKAALLARVGAL